MLQLPELSFATSKAEESSLCLTSRDATMCLFGMEKTIILESVFKDTKTKARKCKHYLIALLVWHFHKEQWKNHWEMPFLNDPGYCDHREQFPRRGEVVTGITAGDCWVALGQEITPCASIPPPGSRVQKKHHWSCKASWQKVCCTSGCESSLSQACTHHELHYALWSKIHPCLACRGVRAEMSLVPRRERIDPERELKRAVHWTLTSPAWLQLFTLDFPSGGKWRNLFMDIWSILVQALGKS